MLENEYGVSAEELLGDYEGAEGGGIAGMPAGVADYVCTAEGKVEEGVKVYAGLHACHCERWLVEVLKDWRFIGTLPMARCFDGGVGKWPLVY